MTREQLRTLHRRAHHGVPPAFPVAQFPNAPLLVALGVWAWQEAAHGVNWFRRLLGVAGLAFVVARLADRLQA